MLSQIPSIHCHVLSTCFFLLSLSLCVSRPYSLDLTMLFFWRDSSQPHGFDRAVLGPKALQHSGRIAALSVSFT